MKKVVLLIAFFGFNLYYNQQVTPLVYADGVNLISKENFINTFGFTLKNDPSQVKDTLLSNYITLSIKQRLAKELNINKDFVYGNRRLFFINEKTKEYQTKDPIYKKYYQLLENRLPTEVEYEHFKVKNCTPEIAKQFVAANEIPKKYNPEYFATSFFQRAGEIPFEIENQLYSNLSNKQLLSPIKKEDTYFFTRLSQIRPYTGYYEVQLLLTDSTNIALIDKLRNKAIEGEDFTEIVKMNSKDDSALNGGYMILESNTLDESLQLAFENTTNNGISPIFTLKNQKAFVKVLKKEIALTSDIIDKKLMSSLFYQDQILVDKNEIMRTHFQIKENPTVITEITKDKKLHELLKNKSLDTEEMIETIANYYKENPNLNKILFSMNTGYSYYISDFVLSRASDLSAMVVNQKLDELLSQYYEYAIKDTLGRMYKDEMPTFLPDFKNEIEQFDVITLAEMYDTYQINKAKNNLPDLQRKYETIKTHYQWGDRVHINIAYCGDKKENAEMIQKVLQSGQSVEQIADKYLEKNILFKEMTVEADADFLPKNYKASKGTKIFYENGQYLVIQTIENIKPSLASFEELKEITIKLLTEEYISKDIQQYKKNHNVYVDKQILNSL